jgi:hypothetical protein
MDRNLIRRHYWIYIPNFTHFDYVTVFKVEYFSTLEAPNRVMFLARYEDCIPVADLVPNEPTE